MRISLLLITITLITYSSVLRAQPILNQADIGFQIGDSFTFDSIQYIDLSNQTGANMVWDLSSLPVYETYSGMTVIPIGDTPSPELHPGSTLGTQVEIEGQSFFQYFDNSNSGMEFYGTSADAGGNNIEIIYTDAELVYPFPLTYNSSGFDTYSQSTDIVGNESISTGVIDWTVPGYGTLIINGQTHEETLLYQFQRLDTNMISFGDVTFSTYSQDLTYAFFAAGYRYPIAIFTESQTSNDFEPVTTTYHANYLFSQTTGLPASELLDIDLTLFPNPMSQGRFSIQVHMNDALKLTATLYSMDGRMIDILLDQVPFANGDHRMDLELPRGLESGIYSLIISNEGRSLHKALMVR